MLLYAEYLVLRSLSDSLISLNFIIYIPKELLDVARSGNYTYGSIRESYPVVVDYLSNTIGQEQLSWNSKAKLIRQNALKNITVVIRLFGSQE